MSPSVLPHLLIKKTWRTLICHWPRLFLWGVLQAKFQLLQMKEFTKGAINSALRNLKAPYVSLVKTNKISLNGHVDSFLINTQFRRWMCRNRSKIFMRKCKQLLSWHRHVIEHHHSEIGWKEKNFRANSVLGTNSGDSHRRVTSGNAFSSLKQNR